MDSNKRYNNWMIITIAILYVVITSIQVDFPFYEVETNDIDSETDAHVSTDSEIINYKSARGGNTRSGDDENWSGSWAPKAPMPTARDGFAIGVVNGKIYAIGGSARSHPLGINTTNVTEEYDPVTNTWTKKAPMPTAREKLAIAVVNDKIYAIGGYYEEGEFPPLYYRYTLATVECYDPITDTWSTLADMPTPRYGLAAGVVNGKIYAIGGNSNDSIELNVTEEYNPDTNAWVTKAPMPTSRDGLAAAVVNNRIYAIGGWSGGSTDVIEEYDPGINTWKMKNPMPTARFYFATGVINNKIYAVGGSPGGGGREDSNEEYDPETNSWLEKVPIPTARGLLAIGVVDDLLYAIGGDDWAGRVINVVEEYNTYPPHRIVITPLNATITADQNQKLNATIFDKFNNSLYFDVNWETTFGYIYDGLFHPTSAGKFIIYANFSHDSYNLSTTANVTVISDNDNDGIYDFYELNNGLDIHNASDAFFDPDLDSLTNLQEFLNGTHLYINDTDGDNLGDGFEVIFSKTNASLWDSNGNGVGDGLEFIQSKGYLGWIESLPDDWIGMTITWDNYTILVKTNSSLLEGEFDKEEQKLEIKVSGPDGTQGITDIDIPVDLCKPEDIEIKLDNEIINFELIQNATYYHIHVEYTHSTHVLMTRFRQISAGDDSPNYINLLVVLISISIIMIVLVSVIKTRKENGNIIETELPPEELLKLLEKEHVDGEITDETYEDVKSFLEEYQD
jgi:N-acetylneuraminic acid mutarotase